MIKIYLLPREAEEEEILEEEEVALEEDLSGDKEDPEEVGADEAHHRRMTDASPKPRGGGGAEATAKEIRLI